MEPENESSKTASFYTNIISPHYYYSEELLTDELLTMKSAFVPNFFF